MSSEGRRFLPLGMTEASVLNSLRRHSAADCFTTSRVSLQDSSSLTAVPSISITHPETRSFGISIPKASAMSLLPMFAMHWRARDTWTGFLLARSFLML